MNAEEFIQNFSEAVDFQDPVPLTLETTLEELEEWDSLAALAVIVMFNMQYEKTIDGDNIRRCKTIGDLFKLAGA